jgi:hypothetical protein
MSIKFILVVKLIYKIHMVVSNFTLDVALTGNFHAEKNLTIHQLDLSCKIHILCVPIKQRKEFIFRILTAGLCAPNQYS